ncbi:MAG: OmpA family protein [Bacteroidetes bacterium]|nr:OmpA family protein [Bacteroidota bacterium]
MGRDDIYKYAKEHYNNFELIIHVVEKKYESPNDPNSKIIGKSILQDAGIELENLTTNEFRKNSLTNDRGEAVFLLDKNSNYKVSATKRNYFSKSVQTTTIGLATLDSILVRMHVEIELERIFPEKEIVINNIYYDLDKATLRPESQLTLDTLIEFFQENEHLTIEIGSHTDARGSNEYNQKLSQERAQSVVDYLISKKVNPAKIIAKGYGETKLVNKCADGVDCTEEEHQQNRRTTFRVVGEGVNLKSGE